MMYNKTMGKKLRYVIDCILWTIIINASSVSHLRLNVCVFYNSLTYIFCDKIRFVRLLSTPLTFNKTFVAMHNVILFILQHVIINASSVCYCWLLVLHFQSCILRRFVHFLILHFLLLHFQSTLLNIVTLLSWTSSRISPCIEIHFSTVLFCSFIRLVHSLTPPSFVSDVRPRTTLKRSPLVLIV